MRRNDLTGQRFGKLTAIKYLGKSLWLCNCDCGKDTKVLSGNLARGHTTSCGCAKIVDLTGKRFGRLTVLEEAPREKGDYVKRYVCKCDCGNTKIIPAQTLARGTCTSCGCYANEQHSKAIKQNLFVDGTQPTMLQSRLTAANISGVVGVNWDKSRGKWQASIKFKGKKYNLGRFEHMQDAIDVRQKAEKEIFGPFLEWYEAYKTKKP